MFTPLEVMKLMELLIYPPSQKTRGLPGDECVFLLRRDSAPWGLRRRTDSSEALPRRAKENDTGTPGLPGGFIEAFVSPPNVSVGGPVMRVWIPDKSIRE